jgi:hypothetical protein
MLKWGTNMSIWRKMKFAVRFIAIIIKYRSLPVKMHYNDVMCDTSGNDV